MSDFVNPTTADLRMSVNDMPPPWVVCLRAELEAWAVIPRQYRKWVVDHIEEMTAGEKSAVDAAILAAQRTAAKAQLDKTEDILRAFMLSVLDELNLHAEKHNAILDAIDAASSLSNLQTRVAAISNYPARTTQQLRDAIGGKLGS